MPLGNLYRKSKSSDSCLFGPLHQSSFVEQLIVFQRFRRGSCNCTPVILFAAGSVLTPIYFFDSGPRGLALPCFALSVVQDHAQSYLHALKITWRTIEMKRAAQTISKS